MHLDWLALDIGGANLKLADGQGFAASYPFAMWQAWEQLAQELRTLIAESPASDRLAVTMTGELADCFETKSAGVRFILKAVQEAADGRHVRIYLNDGKLVTPHVAAACPLLAASSNWHALASFCGRFVPRGGALLMDLGSTTCDLIPLVDGRIATSSLSDTDRLLRGELVYTGVERSPLCGVIQQVPYRGQSCPVAQELFATTRDAYLVLGMLREDETNTNTADGRGSTAAAAQVRLGRMLCATGEAFDREDAIAMAEAVVQQQVNLLLEAARKVIAGMSVRPEAMVVSGHGDVVVRRVVSQLEPQPELIFLQDQLGGEVSRCAPAHALAMIAAEAADV
ncbi:MAG TPA: H4MPT-linked C1 transfer pathway protein [Planctomycetaceae bacterium]|nr:H4MPT-linked C1 transfer pathway protein [Blastopirellula sp.]HAY80009.1 H4MPT-linked C1 transfer pathway protein [Planctomycetaceae bacterium]